MSDDPLVLKVVRLRPEARLPMKAHDHDAAFDLASIDPVYAANGVQLIRTGLAIELPAGWHGQILGRSSLAAKGISVLGGVMDSSYRGEWVVCLWVPPGHAHRIAPGDRVAQFVVHRSPAVLIEEAEELSPSGRGPGGFGSSGR